MNKFIIGICMSFIFFINTYGAEIVVGSYPAGTDFAINTQTTGTGVLFVDINNYTGANATTGNSAGGLHIRNYLGQGINYNCLSSNANEHDEDHAIIELVNHYVFAVSASGVKWSGPYNRKEFCVSIYDKRDYTWQHFDGIARNDAASTNANNIIIGMDQNNLYIKDHILPQVFQVDLNTGSGSETDTSMPTYNISTNKDYIYRASSNNINWLNESSEQYAYVLRDQQGDYFGVYEPFVSLFNFKGYSYLYDDGDIIFSIFGENIIGGDNKSRLYDDYENDQSDYIVDKFGLYLDDNGAVTVNPPGIAGEKLYKFNEHQPLYFPVNVDGVDLLYYVNDLNEVVKESDFILKHVEFFAPPYTTGTGSISYDEDIFNWDKDGDGDVEFLNGEIFIGIADFLKYLWEGLLEFFGNLKTLLEEIGKFGNDEVKTFGFNLIPVASATDISSIINNNVNEEDFKETPLGKIDIYIKGFLAFIFIVIGMSTFIYLNRNKNG